MLLSQCHQPLLPVPISNQRNTICVDESSPGSSDAEQMEVVLSIDPRPCPDLEEFPPSSQPSRHISKLQLHSGKTNKQRPAAAKQPPEVKSMEKGESLGGFNPIEKE